MKLSKLKRPSLCWMSVDDIIRVNGKINGLCMKRGQWIEVACPAPYWGRIRIHAELPVLFEYIPANARLDSTQLQDGAILRLWLSLSRERPPKWSYQIGDAEVEYGLPFNDKRAAIVVELLKHYRRHFPFVSTDNYFVNNGECVA